MHVASAHPPGDKGALDAGAFRLFGGRSFTCSFVVFIGCKDRNEAAVQDADYFRIGERTRPQGKCPASTAAGLDPAIVGKHEYRAVERLGERLCRQNSVYPADLVDAPRHDHGRRR